MKNTKQTKKELKQVVIMDFSRTKRSVWNGRRRFGI